MSYCTVPWPLKKENAKTVSPNQKLLWLRLTIQLNLGHFGTKNFGPKIRKEHASESLVTSTYFVTLRLGWRW